MLYWSVLAICTLIALLNPRGRMMACVLVLNWAMNWLMVERGLYAWVPYSDALAFYGVLYLHLHQKQDSGRIVIGLCFAALAAHAVYGLTYALRLDYSAEYMYLLNGLFLTAMAILASGGGYVKSLVGTALEGLGRAGGRQPRPHHACEAPPPEKAGR